MSPVRLALDAASGGCSYLPEMQISELGRAETRAKAPGQEDARLMALYIALAVIISFYAPYLIWQWRSGELDDEEEVLR